MPGDRSRLPGAAPLTRPALLRLCLVRFAASFLLILTAGILNRILIADLRVTALIVTVVLSFQHLTSPFALVTGHLSDRQPIRGRRRVPYIRLWTALSASLVPLMPEVGLRMGDGWIWMALGAALFGIFGLGLKAANLLVGALIVDRNPDLDARGRALNTIWIMAIAGFVLAGVYFSVLLPAYDPAVEADQARLRLLCWVTAAGAFAVTWIGTLGVEPAAPPGVDPAPVETTRPHLWDALLRVVASRRARRLFAFLVVADFTFFIQEFVLEAFGGEVFHMPVSVTTSFNITFGLGMLCTMFAAGALAVLVQPFPTRPVLVGGCVVGALSFAVLAFAAVADESTALLTSVFVLGLAKGLYNVGLAFLFTALGRTGTAGVLMGAWGAFGGFAVALGGLAGGLLVDAARALGGDVETSYGLVFGVEVIGMVVAVILLLRDRSAGVITTEA